LFFRRRAFGLIALLLVRVAPPATAHSLKELEDQLSTSDQYFQPVDRAAPPFELVDAEGRPVRMADLLGKVIVLNFIYATCGDVCPLHSAVIAQLQKKINETPMKNDVAFVSITTDPAHDRGAVLTEYGSAQGLDPVNWTFLTSPPEAPEDSTRQLAKAYGLEFTETADGAQMHGLVTHVIDRNGRLRGRFHGLDFDPVSLVVFANALVNDLHGPGEREEAQPADFWSWFGSLFALSQGPRQ
jgi:protein SCO1